MANRDLNFSPDVTAVTPEEPNSTALGIAAIGDKVAETSEQSKVLIGSTKLHVGYKQLDAQFRSQYAGDPTNAQGLQDLAEARKNLSDTMGDDISPFFQRQWQEKSAELAGQSDVSNEVWTVHQQRVNTVANVNTSIRTYTDMANHDGQAYGTSGATDGGNIMNFLTARQQIEQFGSTNLGAEKTGVLLKNFNSDYVKAFVSGVAETSPQRAVELLNNPDVQSNFTTEERGEMLEQVARVKRQQALAQTLTTTQNNSSLPDIVNNPETTYYEKRAQIDQLDMQGAITPKAAAASRRVIKSSNDLDTQTDTPVMADIINRTYDLNASAATNGSEYLLGVQNLQHEILDKQASGQLTAPDAAKLNKQLTDLTSKKISDATQQVGNEFYDANQKFNALPPEYRGEATRQLFYASYGNSYTKQQYAAQAQAIIDNTNAKRRADAQKSADIMATSNTTLLKSLNASPADVTATAKKYGITEQEVIHRLRAAHLDKASKRLGPTSNAAPDDDETPAAPVVLKGAPETESPDENALEGGEE